MPLCQLPACESQSQRGGAPRRRRAATQAGRQPRPASCCGAARAARAQRAQARPPAPRPAGAGSARPCPAAGPRCSSWHPQGTRLSACRAAAATRWRAGRCERKGRFPVEHSSALPCSRAYKCPFWHAHRICVSVCSPSISMQCFGGGDCSYRVGLCPYSTRRQKSRGPMHCGVVYTPASKGVA